MEATLGASVTMIVFQPFCPLATCRTDLMMMKWVMTISTMLMGIKYRKVSRDSDISFLVLKVYKSSNVTIQKL